MNDLSIWGIFDGLVSQMLVIWNFIHQRIFDMERFWAMNRAIFLVIKGSFSLDLDSSVCIVCIQFILTAILYTVLKLSK